MDCEQYREQFTDFLEGTLPEGQWRELEAHLQQCPACAADIKAFRQTVSALSNLELVEPPPHLVRAISQRIGGEAAAASQPAVAQVPSPTRRRFSWQVAGALAAAGLMVVFVAVYGIHSRWSPAVKTTGDISLPAGRELAASPPSAEITPPEPEISESVEAPAPAEARPSEVGGVRLAERPRVEKQPPRETVTPPPSARTAEVPVAPSGVEGTVPEEVGPLPLGADNGSPVPFSAASTRGAGMASPAAVGVQVHVEPPRERTVGEWGRLRVSVMADGEVPQVTVRVVGEGALRVKGSGLVYQGALTARRTERCTAQIQAEQPGDHRLSVILDSDTPGVSTRVPVVIEGYQAAAPTPIADQTYRRLRSVPLAEAARLIGADCGLTVQVHSALAEQRVTADFSGGVSGPVALRLLAQMTGGELQHENGTYRLVPRV